ALVVRLAPPQPETRPPRAGCPHPPPHPVCSPVAPVGTRPARAVPLRGFGLLPAPRPPPPRRPDPPRPTGRRPGPDPGPGRPVPRARTAAAHQGGAEPRLGAPLHRPHPRTTGPQPHRVGVPRPAHRRHAPRTDR